MRKTWFFLAVILVGGCKTPDGNQDGPRQPPKRDPYVQAINTNGKFVVLSIDISKSMDFNDPRRFNEQGSNLAVAITASADNMGLVAFSTDAAVRAKLQQMEQKANRLEFQRQINSLGREGQTNYTAALQESAEMLKRANAGPGASVIFLTDGEHNQGPPAEALKQATLFAQRQWKVYVVTLGPEASKSQLAKDIALKTEAAYFEVQKPEELMQAFLKILAQINTFVEFSGGIRPINVLPGTRRLVYLMIKEAPETTIEKLTLGGSVVDWNAEPNVYKYPVRADRRGDFEALHIEEPKSGTWEATITGPAKVGWILAQPAFSLSLEDGAPRSDYRAGEEIRIALKADGNADAIKVLTTSAKARAVISDPAGNKIAEMELKSAGEGRWTASTTAQLKGDQEELQQVVIAFSYQEEGGGEWAHEKRATVLVKPGKREATIGISANSVDFGAVWADSEATAEVELSNGGQEAKLTAKSSGESVSVSPDAFDLGSNQKRKVVLKVKATGDSGDREETVSIEGRQSDGSRVVIPTIRAAWKVVKLEGKPSFDLGKVKQGQEFKVPVDYSVAGKKLKVDIAGLEGGVEGLKIVEENGKYFVIGKVPTNAEDKKYTGEVSISIDGETVPPKKVPVTLDVAGAEARVVVEPTKISISTTKEDEWSGATFKITLEHVRDAKVKFVRGDLVGKEGKIDKGLQQKVEFKDWDGKTLKAGATGEVTFSVKPTNDNKRETYEGVLKITIDDGKRPTEVEVPVTLEFKNE
jgi:Mg-chelatase subunit ChlD